MVSQSLLLRQISITFVTSDPSVTIGKSFPDFCSDITRKAVLARTPPVDLERPTGGVTPWMRSQVASGGRFRGSGRILEPEQGEKLKPSEKGRHDDSDRMPREKLGMLDAERSDGGLPPQAVSPGMLSPGPDRVVPCWLAVSPCGGSRSTGGGAAAGGPACAAAAATGEGGGCHER